MKHGKNVKSPATDAPAQESGSGVERVRKRDLSFMVGTWQDDAAFDEAIADQDKVDEEMWP